MDELFTGFAIAMGTGMLMVFAVLVLLFARVFQPITILSALPLGDRRRGRRAADHGIRRSRCRWSSAS